MFSNDSLERQLGFLVQRVMNLYWYRRIMDFRKDKRKKERKREKERRQGGRDRREREREI